MAATAEVDIQQRCQLPSLGQVGNQQFRCRQYVLRHEIPCLTQDFSHKVSRNSITSNPVPVQETQDMTGIVRHTKLTKKLFSLAGLVSVEG